VDNKTLIWIGIFILVAIIIWGITHHGPGGLPDLVVHSCSAPTPDTRGSLISVSAVISNQSGTGIAGSSFACFYLNTTTNTMGASFLGSYLIPGLGFHGWYSLTTNVTVPANQPTGQDYFLVVCNCSNTVIESNPNNDTNFVGVTIN
jgi:CARDB